MDAQRLDRDRGADRAERDAGIVGRLEVAAMERAPGVLQGVGQRLGIQQGAALPAAFSSAAARLASGNGSQSPA